MKKRPLTSFAGCQELDADYAVLLRRAAGDAYRHATYANNLAFRFREAASGGIIPGTRQCRAHVVVTE